MKNDLTVYQQHRTKNHGTMIMVSIPAKPAGVGGGEGKRGELGIGVYKGKDMCIHVYLSMHFERARGKIKKEKKEKKKHEAEELPKNIYITYTGHP